jgi:response regulator NasT
MPQVKVALLQQESSPLRDMLNQALAGAQVEVLKSGSAPAPPPDAFCGGRLLLWDLWGFDAGEIQVWSPMAELDDVGLVLATPLLDDQASQLALRCGALGLIGPSHGVGLARAQLEIAARCQKRICQLLEREAALRQQLAERKIIEKAKSILIASMNLSEPEAMRGLQQQARRTNQKLVEVARKVISTHEVFNKGED